MPLTAEQVEASFVETVREQENGEPFNWHRVAEHLNRRVADNRVGRARFLLQERGPIEGGKP